MRRPARSPTSSEASVGKGVLAAGAALLVLGGGALGYALTRKAVGGMTERQTKVMSAAVATLEGDIKTAKVSVDQRAETMGGFALVRRAVGTDPATAVDLVGKELTVKPGPGEVIELGQISKPAGQPL